jgi:glyoxylase-like metal-dependent hydrolase (beta-lactamase superfamily II)
MVIEEVFRNIYRMEIPLPESPLKAINAYVIRDRGRNLIIDTGMNRRECREAMDEGLRALGVDLSATDFFITHHHADHFGLVSEMAGEGSRICFNRPDARFFQIPDIWDRIVEAALANGFPAEEVAPVMSRHPARRYQQQGPLNLTFLQEGDTLTAGGYTFRCVETPGHTPGHLCLYDPDTRIFFAGDHILEDITPNIIMFDENANPLAHYLESLDKIDRFDISHVFPGHRRVFSDCRGRIAELKHHHALRLKEVKDILAKGRKSAYETASRMSWDIECEDWGDFPVAQKWFATGEAYAHLLYLTAQGEVIRERADGGTFFALA